MLATPDSAGVRNNRQRPLRTASANAAVSNFVIVTARERSARRHTTHRGPIRPTTISWPAHGEHCLEAGGTGAAHRLADDDPHVLPHPCCPRGTLRRLPRRSPGHTRTARRAPRAIRTGSAARGTVRP